MTSVRVTLCAFRVDNMTILAESYIFYYFFVEGSVGLGPLGRVFWRETPSVNIVSIASYKMNHNAAIRKQMWFIFLLAIDYTFTNPMIHFSLK